MKTLYLRLHLFLYKANSNDYSRTLHLKENLSHFLSPSKAKYMRAHTHSGDWVIYYALSCPPPLVCKLAFWLAKVSAARHSPIIPPSLYTSFFSSKPISVCQPFITFPISPLSCRLHMGSKHTSSWGLFRTYVLLCFLSDLILDCVVFFSFGSLRNHLATTLTTM